MNRSSLRIKQYRPVSADFTKVNALSAVFGLNGSAAGGGVSGGGGNAENADSSGDPNGGVQLINYKRSTTDLSTSSSNQCNFPIPSNNKHKSKPSTSSSVGLAPIAQDEDLDSNFNDSFNEDDDPLKPTAPTPPGSVPPKCATPTIHINTSPVRTSTPQKRRSSLPCQPTYLEAARQPTLNKRQNSHSHSHVGVNLKLEASSEDSFLGSDLDEGDEGDEFGFESFSATEGEEDDDEDDENESTSVEEEEEEGKKVAAAAAAAAAAASASAATAAAAATSKAAAAATSKAASPRKKGNHANSVKNVNFLDVESMNRNPDDSRVQHFMKTRSLRDKFRDSKGGWSLRRTSDKADITSPPPPAVAAAAATSATSNSSCSSSLNVSDSGSDGSSLATVASEGRLSRLFSLRRSIGAGGSQDSSSPCSSKNAMPRLTEEEEQMLGGSADAAAAAGRRAQPPALSPLRKNLSPEQQKRRHIVASLVHSENNYVATLQRLVNDYKKPLEDSSPPILSASKTSTLFHRVPEILQCHLLFRIALNEAIRKWDDDEKIGDVFVASFSKAVVLEIYSDFINNFSSAMDCAKQESKRKSALADFLKVKQITAHDRVSFFGLMVKPVQRFPQFILLLQDLLKETPPGHADRMALQLALTTLESLAEMLNERKREAEQFAACRDKIRNISTGKFSSRSLQAIRESGGNKFLLKEDDVTQLEFNNHGHVLRSKPRRLLLLNDHLLCVTVNGRSSEVDFNASSPNERLSLKWMAPVREVELVDGTSGGTLARLMAPSAAGSSLSSSSSSNATTLAAMGKRASLSRTTSSSQATGAGSGTDPASISDQAESLAQDMADLMQDFETVSRIASMISLMRGKYDGLDTSVTSRILTEIQQSICKKNEEMAFMDGCCLQLTLKGSGGGGGGGGAGGGAGVNGHGHGSSSKGKDKPETYTFQTRDPNVKKEWIVELRLAQLALDPINSPAWDVLEQERSISTKMPLFVKSFQVYHNGKTNKRSEANCGSSYSLMVQTPTRTLRKQTYVWTNVSICGSSDVRIFSLTSHETNLKELGTLSLPDVQVQAIQYVPGLNNGVATNAATAAEPLRADLVWVGTNKQKILIYSASDPERGLEVGCAHLPGDEHLQCLAYHCDAVWVGLSSGSVLVFRRNFVSGVWDLRSPQEVLLSDEPVSCILPTAHAGLYVACGKRVWVVDALTNEQLKHFTVQPQSPLSPAQAHPYAHPYAHAPLSNAHSLPPLHMCPSPSDSLEECAVHQMAQSGVGLWVALSNSATICLYHTETFRHLQDINIASNVSRVLAARNRCQTNPPIHVTALMASRGLLWVGTSVGVALTVPLPRLEGVPIISGRSNVSYHSHYGPVSFFLNLQHKVVTEIQLNVPPTPTPTPTPPITTGAAAASTPVVQKQSIIKEESDEHESETSNNSATPEEEEKQQQQQDSVTCKLRIRPTSPPMSRRRSRHEHQPASRRTSKTLPRGFSLAQHNQGDGSDPSSLDCDVFGLYSNLLNQHEYDCDSGDLAIRGCGGQTESDLRKSDPDLLNHRVNTLDRRVRMKTSRPRSLDMSSWSVESRGSALTTSSSEAGSERPSPNVSRNASFQSAASGASVSSLNNQSQMGFGTAAAASPNPVVTTANATPVPANTPPPALQAERAKQSSELAKDSSQASESSTNACSGNTNANATNKRNKKLDLPKTVTTLMGGRGYINWMRPSVEKQANSNDAYLVFWEMKL